MNIWYLSSGRLYDQFLVSALKVIPEVLFEEVAPNQFKTKLRKFIENVPFPLTIVVDVKCIASIRLMANIFKTCCRATGLSAITVVLLTDFSSWSGKNYLTPIIDFESEFKQRKPLSCSQEQYSIENLLSRVTQEYGAGLYMVGHGLFYGSGGLDLHEIFRYENLEKKKKKYSVCSFLITSLFA
jgi:hypothetical protein